LNHPLGLSPQNCMVVPAGFRRRATTGYVPVVVDRERLAEASAEVAKINHPAAVGPQERRVTVLVRGLAHPSNLSQSVYHREIAVHAPQRAEVEHPARLGPEE